MSPCGTKIAHQRKGPVNPTKSGERQKMEMSSLDCTSQLGSSRGYLNLVYTGESLGLRGRSRRGTDFPYRKRSDTFATEGTILIPKEYFGYR